jgi:hypothetical protein
LPGSAPIKDRSPAPWDLASEDCLKGEEEGVLLSRFHPIYHSYTYQAGSRVDIERVLEPALDYEDRDDLIDRLSAAPTFFERLSPVTTTVGTTEIKGRNWTDMMIKGYRVFGKIYTRVTTFLRQSLVNNYNESTMVPYMSITVDPDTLVRLLEHDYEAGENSTSKLIELFRTGVVAPSITTPFHSVLPLLPDAFDRRLSIRLGLLFYAPVLRAYEQYLKDIKENQMVVAFWPPEGLITEEIIRILYEEFLAMCQRERFRKPHLVLLLDASLAKGQPLDRVMKTWCQIKAGSEDGARASVVFRDPAFSAWMMTSHPSIKKIIDRTIAKTDRGLDEHGVDYGWSHFESIEALTRSPKDAVNLEQRILKLCELGYLSVSPDVYVRRKIAGRFGIGENEPLLVELNEVDPESDPVGKSGSFGAWRGWGVDKAGNRRVAPSASYTRKLRRGVEKIAGSPCWKIAWTLTRDHCFELVGGKPSTMSGGMLGVLADLTGIKKKETIRSNVEDFLVEYGLVHWREHFIQYDITEADIRLDEIIDSALRKGARKQLSPEEIAAAGYAAQAYFFLLDSCNSYGQEPENMDQRALFQNAVMLTLAFTNAVAVHHYLGQKKKADQTVDLLERELLDFASAYDRYDLASFGVTKSAWNRALKSEVPESTANVVERAARRTAARHLPEFGYGGRFGEEDEEITTNVGHIWSREVDIPNYRWANSLFCGVREA